MLVLESCAHGGISIFGVIGPDEIKQEEVLRTLTAGDDELVGDGDTVDALVTVVNG